MKTLLFLSLSFFGFCFLSHAQGRDTVLLSTCNTANEVTTLTPDEKQIILLLNFVRTHPDEFLKQYLPDAADKLHEQSSAEYRSLERELRKMKPVGLLLPDEILRKAATLHAQDMGRTGRTGHTSSKGKNFETRLGTSYTDMAENCDYGYSNPILIVCHLLIDKDVSGLGHRKNILNPVYKKIGVSIQPHKKFGMNCVMDMAD